MKNDNRSPQNGSRSISGNPPRDRRKNNTQDTKRGSISKGKRQTRAIKPAGRNNFTPEKNSFKDEFDDDNGGVFHLEGRNPILEALKNDTPIDTLLVKKGEHEGTIRVITAMAREKGVLIKEMSPEKLATISKTGNHQGVIAICSVKAYVSIDDMLETAKRRGRDPFILLLDGITDPHNLGAIIRTAEAAGVDGIIIPKRRSVGLTPVVAKVAAGAVEYVNLARVSNISNAIDELKKKGLWVYCADMTGENLYTTELTGGIALVIGGEGEGVSRLIKEKCDFVLKIPMFGKISSLNASVAASLLMYEVVRGRVKKLDK